MEKWQEIFPALFPMYAIKKYLCYKWYMINVNNFSVAFQMYKMHMRQKYPSQNNDMPSLPDSYTEKYQKQKFVFFFPSIYYEPHKRFDNYIVKRNEAAKCCFSVANSHYLF